MTPLHSPKELHAASVHPTTLYKLHYQCNLQVMELDTYKALDDRIERRSNGRSGKHFVDQLLSLLQYESHLLEPFLQVCFSWYSCSASPYIALQYSVSS
jgi:hypothetical protein